MDGQLYYLCPRAVISDMVENLDSWKLILPRNLRRDALIEAHRNPQADHLEVEKTYQRLAAMYY